MGSLQPGAVVGRDFRVVRHLASGAMGAVYIVDQLSTGKQRAMKVMTAEIANNERARDRFVLEARVGAKIESDHVVEVVTAGIDEASGVPFLVMELLKGEELSDLVKRQGAMSLRDVAEILKQAGHALAQAHAQGIVHRDIKPDNLFIAESRRTGVPFTVKILDFGIAKLIAERTAAGTQPIGTPLFMAPEQTDRKGEIAPWSDVWPLGLIAFYMLVGGHYWKNAGEGINMLLREVLMDPIVPASQRAAEYGVGDRIPAGFDAWFANCVNRERTQRFRHAGEAVAAFQQLVLADAPPGVLTGNISSQALPTGPVVPADLAAGATVHADPSTLPGGIPGTAGTNLTAASSMVHEQPKGKGGLIAGVVVVLLAAGAAGAYFALAGSDESAPAAPIDVAASASASAAVAKAAAPCPDGMLLIEGGNMFMGSMDEDLDPDVRPPHKVKLASFCLDKTEVTVAAYKACSEGGNCLRAPGEVKFPGAGPKEIEHYSTLCNAAKDAQGQHPVNCVDWQMASAFCSGEGGRLKEGGARLPSEAEWEFAARGSRQSKYPWGDDEPGPKRLNGCGAECKGWIESVQLRFYGVMFEGDDGHAATAPVGSYPDGASSSGALDLAGNVWEWTNDWYAPYTADAQTDPKGPTSGTERVVRGGGFNGLKPAWAKPAYRWKTTPDSRSHGIGFRCASDPRG